MKIPTLQWAYNFVREPH